MGLRATLNGQMSSEPQSRPTELRLIQDLQQTVQTLKSRNSTLLSENQELRLNLTNATGQIELLTNRAATVNAIEMKNQELLATAEKERKKSVEAERNASIAYAEEMREERRRKAAEAKTAEAEKEIKTAWEEASRIKEWYDVVFTVFSGFVLFSVFHAVISLIERRSVLKECGAWFANRGKGIASFSLWVKSSFIRLSVFFSGKLPLPVAVCWIITAVIYAAALTVCVAVFRYIFMKLREKWDDIAEECIDGTTKALIVVSSFFGLFYFCLYYYEAIKAVISVNIFTTWLLMCAASALGIYGKEIIAGFKDG